jgi:hypothetical protein
MKPEDKRRWALSTHIAPAAPFPSDFHTLQKQLDAWGIDPEATIERQHQALEKAMRNTGIGYRGGGLNHSSAYPMAQIP